MLEALVHLIKRAPVDNAVAESRQAALLREIREKFEATVERLAILEKSLEATRKEVALRSDLDGLITRLQRQEVGLAAKLNFYPDGDEEPELAMIAHLSSQLRPLVALDIGAHVGSYSEALLDAGFEVHAFEPNPKVLNQLRARLEPRKGFTCHGIAIGAREGTLPMHLLEDSTADHVYRDVSALSTLTTHALPEGLAYAGTVDVPVRTLEGLHRDGVIPAEVGYVKIDTEGFDLEVVRGMGSQRYPVISAEFWDKTMEFGRSGALNALPDLVAELQERGYLWWIVIYRVWGDGSSSVRFYCNVARSVEQSWGNAFFFRDHALFAEAERWCSAVLPRTYFAPIKRGNGAQTGAQSKATI